MGTASSPFSQRFGGIPDQAPRDTSALKVMTHMEIVEQRSPDRVVVKHGMDEGHNVSILVRADGDGPPRPGRVGESLPPHLCSLHDSLPIQVAVGEETAKGSAPALGVQGCDRVLITRSRQPVLDTVVIVLGRGTSAAFRHLLIHRATARARPSVGHQVFMKRSPDPLRPSIHQPR